MAKVEEIYNGLKIRFDEQEEVWYACVIEDRKNADYETDDNRVENKSLKKLKELLDIMKRQTFKRMPVFVRISRYRHGGGEDKKYDPQYDEAVMTSLAPNGNAFTVIKGQKHGEKTNIRYSESEIILDTPENRKIIATIEEAGEAEWKAEVLQKSLKEKLKHIDGRKVYKEVYGKDFQ